MELVKIRPEWSKGDPNSRTGVFIRGENSDTQGEGRVKTEAEVGGVRSQAKNTKGCQQPPEAARDKEASSSESFRESRALLTP